MFIKTALISVMILSLNLLMIHSIPGDNDGITRIFKHIGEYKIDNTTQSYVKNFYTTYSIKADWATALLFCDQFNMKLAILGTKEEELWFLKTWNETGFNATYEHAYLAGTDEGSPGQWYWATTGKLIEYQLMWKAGAPDNLGGNEHCLDLYSGAFNDAPCTEGYKFAFICEKVNKIKKNSAIY